MNARNILLLTGALTISLLVGMTGVFSPLEAGPRKVKKGAPSPTEISPALVGTSIDSISLKTSNGKRVDLKKLAAKKPLVVVFYRGSW